MKMHFEKIAPPETRKRHLKPSFVYLLSPVGSWGTGGPTWAVESFECGKHAVHWAEVELRSTQESVFGTTSVWKPKRIPHGLEAEMASVGGVGVEA